MTDKVLIDRALLQDLIDDVSDYAESRSFKKVEWHWRTELLEKARALLSASIADTAGAKPVDLLPNALWTRRGSGTDEWWSFKGYQARKDAADQWVLRKGGEELYRHTYLQVVMAHAERALLAAHPAPSVADAGWISASDRLPEFGESVLIGWPDGGTDLSYRFRHKHDKSKWSWEGVSDKHHDAPTHWMVLPRMTAPSVADAAGARQTDAARDVLAERQRQMDKEGWTLKRDDRYINEELALAAIVYAESAVGYHPEAPDTWPWHPDWFKPTTPRRDLVKAGALILAEIERLDRAAIAKESGND